MSFTRTYKAEQTHKSKLEYMMGQVLKGQQKMRAVLDEKWDFVFSDLHDKFETLSDHVKKLDSLVAHNVGFVRRDEGFLPGKTNTNPRRQVCAALLRSGKHLSPSTVEFTSAEKSPENEKETINLDEEEEESEEDQRNMSFTRTYKAEQTHKSKLEYMMGQVLKGQQKMRAVLDEKWDSVFSDLHDKFETLCDHVKKLDSLVAHNVGFVRRDEGFLPGKTNTNPRRQVCAALLRSGKHLSPSTVEFTSAEKSPEDEKAMIKLDEEEEESEEDVEIDRQGENNVDRLTTDSSTLSS
ncbi:hypothetical protein F2Q69_00058863 [Brassica cretica]|uniref:Uncharacterized protein n=1 Tax=Brassica cretica TaxID=69181 RepID=A0A8S9RN30_BRACR|nr:hypothetical protein F2Q69_00058863 [Brassica cretica]